MTQTHQVRPGMSLKERQEARAAIERHWAEWGRRRAYELSRSPVCAGLTVPMAHERCRGDTPGASGCLCECHDGGAAR